MVEEEGGGLERVLRCGMDEMEERLGLGGWMVATMMGGWRVGGR